MKPLQYTFYTTSLWVCNHHYCTHAGGILYTISESCTHILPSLFSPRRSLNFTNNVFLLLLLITPPHFYRFPCLLRGALDHMFSLTERPPGSLIRELMKDKMEEVPPCLWLPLAPPPFPLLPSRLARLELRMNAARSVRMLTQRGVLSLL